MNYQILQGDNRTTLKTIPDNSIDAIITDPPYGIDFLGKSWDANTGALETYQECLRVLKPGGHILAFSAARTYHHLAITLEQAGFEIRDQIMWIYSSGFPKSQDVGRSIQRSLGVKETKERTLNQFGGIQNQVEREGGINYKDNKQRETVIKETVVTDPEAKQWEGWGTALKPAHEPICLARKPIKLSIAKNCQVYGVGALNIDACRVPYDDPADQPSGGENGWSRVGFNETPVEKYCNQKSTKPKPGKMDKAPPNLNAIGTPSTIETSDEPWIPSESGRFPSNVIGEIADYQKYFYCPKVSRKERHMGFELPAPMFGGVQGCYDPESGERFAVGFDARAASIITADEMVKEMGGYFIDADGKETTGSSNMYWVPHLGAVYAHGLTVEYDNWHKARGTVSKGNVGNNHPTVKPVELMKYLIKLITPPGGTVLDPFNGSGSTGMAAVELGHPYIGCELDPKYVEIARTRIEAWYKKHYNPAMELFE